MHKAMLYFILFAAGSALGVIYFTGLWCTLKSLPERKRPMPFMIGSGLIRLSLLLVVFYLIMNGRPGQLAVALTGFILTRGIMIRRLGRNTSSP